MTDDSTTLTIRLPLELKNKLQAVCAQLDLTPSQVIRQMLRSSLTNVQIKAPAPAPIPAPGATLPEPFHPDQHPYVIRPGDTPQKAPAKLARPPQGKKRRK